MKEKNANWLPVRSVPAEGMEIVLHPEQDWGAYLEEFDLPWDVAGVTARLSLFPQEEGMLVRGKFEGQVGMPCSRCAEASIVALDRDFDTFEPYPGEEGEAALAAPVRPRPKVPQERERGAWKPKPQEKERRAPARPESREDEGAALDLEVDENVIRQTPRGLEINVVNLAFEEFLLALPVKTLCRPDCKGVCPVCGQNQNTGACACQTGGGDPRLAKLRELKLGKSE